jgi:hypothetical protein
MFLNHTTPGVGGVPFTTNIDHVVIILMGYGGYNMLSFGARADLPNLAQVWTETFHTISVQIRLYLKRDLISYYYGNVYRDKGKPCIILLW